MNHYSNFIGEMGLIGMAFHPDFQNNGYFYIAYNTVKPVQTIISRFKVFASNPDSADESSELVLFNIPAYTQVHKGGRLVFGSDGYLYIAVGDGGGQGDPMNHGQDRTQLYGKILRIDVNKTSGGLNYSIPSTNPFYNNTSGYRQEIFAYGFRNPWKFSQDPVTNKIWAGDVGNNIAEEIDIVESGVNYGWKIMEGFECFSPSTGCDTTGLRKPVLQYLHSGTDGSSITGGYVYRGTQLPNLYGKYIFGDFISGKIWSLNYDGINPATKSLLADADFSVSTFGIDRNNELYICGYSTGKIYRLQDTTVGINLNSNIIPEATQLFQNYPNPFNPSTKINFTLNKNSFTKLAVFDLQGKEIKSLISGNLNAGDYSYFFNAQNLPSGIYFYRLEANGKIFSKRLIVIK
jgi:glucose/arabinose dehydrogenase